MQTKAMSAFCPISFPVPMPVPTPATMNWHVAIPMAPKSSSGRRPHASTMYRPGKVDPVLTADVIMLMMNGFLMPELVK